jgi:hypothetical protein
MTYIYVQVGEGADAGDGHPATATRPNAALLGIYVQIGEIYVHIGEIYVQIGETCVQIGEIYMKIGENDVYIRAGRRKHRLGRQGFCGIWQRRAPTRLCWPPFPASFLSSARSSEHQMVLERLLH